MASEVVRPNQSFKSFMSGDDKNNYYSWLIVRLYVA